VWARMAVVLVWELGAGLGRQRTARLVWYLWAGLGKQRTEVAGAPGRRGGVLPGRTSEGEEEGGFWKAAGQVHFGEAAEQV